MNRNDLFVPLACSCLLMVGTAFADGGHESDQPGTDSYITTKVKAELAADQNTPARNIHVDTKNGVVSLSGVVKSQSIKDEAEEDARKVTGVTYVHNNIEVR